MSVVILSVGNPGPISRHSVGHYVLKHVVDHYGAPELSKKGLYSVSRATGMLFAKSNAYMNESGKAFRALVSGERVPTSATIVVLYDDFENALGTVKLGLYKKNESHGGIKSIKSVSGDYTVYKLGIGIGPKPQSSSKETMGAWVLSPFSQSEKEGLGVVVERVVMVLEEMGEIEDVGRFNGRMTKRFKELSRA